MTETFKTSSRAYRNLYKEKELLVKVSGAELQDHAFDRLAEAIQVLTWHGIRIILAYGGGEQIDRAWKEKHTEDRPKQNGMSITTKEVLEDAVLPVAADSRRKLEREFSSLIHVVEPQDIHCVPVPGFGYTGNPTHIDIGDSRPLTAVGFVGTAEDQEMNVNADDIALQLVRQHQKRIHEVFFLTKTGGIVDRNERLVSLINEHGVRQIINGTHPTIAVKGGMRKKVLVLRKMLPLAGKIAMTTSAKFLEEIDDWRGSGTLFFHTNALGRSRVQTDIDRSIFRFMYDTYVQEGKFRERSPQELTALMNDHYMLCAKSSPIGGFSLCPREDDWHELSALWSGYIGNGVGDHLLRAAKEEVETKGRAEADTKLFALSTESQLIELFTRADFQHVGKVSAQRDDMTIELPAAIRQYDVDGRDPHVFLYREHLGVAAE